MLLLVLLGGINDHTPLNKFYWIRFDTHAISNSLPNPVQWTLYNYCGVDSNGHNTNCTSNHVAWPFRLRTAFHTSGGVPQPLLDHENMYFYLTRFAYVFYLIAVVFIFVSLLFTFTACFSRLGGAVASFVLATGLLFAAAASAMETATYVKARSAFRDSGVDSHLGTKMFALTWAAVACLLLSAVFLCCTCLRAGKHRREKRNAKYGHDGASATSSGRPLNRESSFERMEEKPAAGRSGRGFFNVGRSKRNDEAAVVDAPPPAATTGETYYNPPAHHV